MNAKQPNALVRETSPYLLQHAYNPVRWEAWSEPVLQRAKDLNKPLLISIGYAACHWCHVMEHECFEDHEVAEVMNAHYIPVKIDREERPDVDQIYMDALQIMTGSGGWPLNIVALPDGRPFWGATYLPKDKWIQALVALARLYREDPDKVAEYATNLTTAVKKINEVLPGEATETPSMEALEAWVASWKPRFDPDYGGTRGAPKFMMPVQLQFLMHWAAVTEDSEVRDHVKTSLRAMALGGLFDHVGGGFSRYSVDVRWHVPHFEKMLYDNAQLISLYAQGFALYEAPLMKEVVQRTIHFVQTELAAPKGGYFASLDADSADENKDLREGAYYVWTETELRQVLGAEFELFSRAYNINAYGHWEDGQYVLIRKETDSELAKSLELEKTEVSRRLSNARNILLERREGRERPKLDDKIITSWNALLLSAFADAARYDCSEVAATAAENLAEFLCTALRQNDGGLLHSIAKGKAGPSGYLEDYATLIEALIKVYSTSGNTRWMDEAALLTEYVLKHFSGKGQALFYYNSEKDPELIRRSVEIADNVVPASNSIMAKNFFLLGLFFGRTQWSERAKSMLIAVRDPLESYSGQYSNWLQLALWLERPFYELVISGPEAGAISESIGKKYLPHILLASNNSQCDYPLFKGRFHNKKTRIFLCAEGACQQPSEDPESVLQQLSQALKEI